MALDDLIPDDVEPPSGRGGRKVKPHSIRCNDTFLERMALYNPAMLQDLIYHHRRDNSPKKENVARTLIAYLDRVIDDNVSDVKVIDEQKEAAKRAKEDMKERYL